MEEGCSISAMPLATWHRCLLLPVEEWSYLWYVEADSQYDYCGVCMATRPSRSSHSRA
jgi:hypothetical protein